MFIFSLIILSVTFAGGAYVENKFKVIDYVKSFFSGGDATEV